MVLSSTIVYESRVQPFENISSSEVLGMLGEIRFDIAELDSSFNEVGLSRVLEVVESGEYKVNGKVLTCIDLSAARSIIEAYRKYSEGGCQSCVELGRETIDAQDASSGWYCRVSDPGFNANARRGRLGVCYSGFSQKVRKHHDMPCDSWNPRFLPPLAELVKDED